MPLVEIAPPDFNVDMALAYATAHNFTGHPVYRRAACYLHADAADRLSQAIDMAAAMGLRLKIFDAFRPPEAQWVLWNHSPDPEFLADPRRGSPHSRGVAIDLTLVEEAGGEANGGAGGGAGGELDMGTKFDDFTPLSHHGAAGLSVDVQTNRMTLLGLMTAAGWDYYRNEWWHYQLFDSKRYPLISDAELPQGMM